MSLRLEVTTEGCVVPTSHKLNQDGYFRKNLGLAYGYEYVMYHRHVWQEMFGEIPKGYEIDHMCKNRACCNPEHLRMLTTSEHRSQDNRMRWILNPRDSKPS